MLTILLIARGNTPTLDVCLQRLQNLSNKVLVGDCGASLPPLNAEVVKLSWSDFATVKNQLSQHVDGWILWVEPWEILGDHEGLDEASLDTNFVYAVRLVYGTTIVHQPRLWHSSRAVQFTNPVFPDTGLDMDGLAPFYLHASGGPDQSDVAFLLRKWREQEPHNPKVYYYAAMEQMAIGNMNGFRSEAEAFLFRSSSVTDAVIMTWYYVAQHELRIKNNLAGTMSYLARCLAARPCMAEFWCLAGEACACHGQMGRAIAFYQNALFFGKRRKLDALPIELPKYREVPEAFLNQLLASEVQS